MKISCSSECECESGGLTCVFECSALSVSLHFCGYSAEVNAFCVIESDVTSAVFAQSEIDICMSAYEQVELVALREYPAVSVIVEFAIALRVECLVVFGIEILVGKVIAITLCAI